MLIFVFFFNKVFQSRSLIQWSNSFLLYGSLGVEKKRVFSCNIKIKIKIFIFVSTRNDSGRAIRAPF